MATIYSIKIKTVSAFVNYNESEIKEIFQSFIKKYRHETTGLGFESTEIDVIKVKGNESIL